MSKLTANKAREMLKNPPHNRPLTTKQKHYFGMVAHGINKYAEGGDLKEYNEHTDYVPQVEKGVVPHQGLSTFDLGSLAGQKQTQAREKEVMNNIINAPDSPMAGKHGGETFNQAYERTTSALRDILQNAPNNSVITTHNTVFSLYSFLNDKYGLDGGMPSELPVEDRKEYTERDGKFKPGDKFNVELPDGRNLIFLRHTDTRDNKGKNFRSPDTDLTRKGVRQAINIGKQLSDMDIPMIISSPLDRAIETSNLIMESHGKKKASEEENTGGWLQKYERGGQIKMQDNYGTMPNYNEPYVSLPPNFTGIGNDTTGRHYSPAWGGQFEDGGNVPSVNSKEMKVGIKVEREHKPTLDYIKKYYKEHNRFPSLRNVAKSIAEDHEKDFPKIKEPKPDTYYKGLVENHLSDEVSKYRTGGEIMNVANLQNPIAKDGDNIGKPLKERPDFKTWWSALSRIAAGGNREDSYGNLGDLYSYFGGRPLKHSVLEISKYKPTNSKNPNATYIAINDDKFKNDVVKNYNRVFLNKDLGKFDKQINDHTYTVSSDDPTIPRIDIAKARELYGKDLWRWYGDRNPSGAIGNYFLSKGKDEKGDYMSYYDVFDIGSGNSKDNHGIMSNDAIGTTLKLTKPFEIYDRIYMNDTTDIRKAANKQMSEPKFNNGGNIPGSVGNMYARIGAPSNGKYAKMTQASAQDGANVLRKEPNVLPEVIIYGAKDKTTREQLNEIGGHPLLSDYIDLPYPLVDPYKQLANQVWESWGENGAPKIRELNDETSRKLGLQSGRAYYEPWFNRMSIRKGNVHDYFAELAHSQQLKSNTDKNDWKKYPTRELYDRYAYYDPTTGEYEAHQIIEPKLKRKYRTSSILSDADIIDYASSGMTPENVTSEDEDAISAVRSAIFLKNFKGARKVLGIPEKVKKWYDKLESGGSVEDGRTVYYQNGLDFTPKSMPEGGTVPLSSKDFTMQLIQSPKYRERISKSYLPESIDPEIQNRLGEVQKTKTAYKDYSGSLSKPYNYQGSNADIPYRVIVDKDQARQLKTSVPSIETHEYGHKEVIHGLNPWEQEQLEGRMKQGQQYNEHDISPIENKSDINSLRQELYNKGVDVFNKDVTPEDIQKLKDSSNYSVKRLFEHYNDNDLLWLLNNIAAIQKGNTNNILAENGIELTKLDQLTNWTNYNKPTKGGWLQKYT